MTGLFPVAVAVLLVVGRRIFGLYEATAPGDRTQRARWNTQGALAFSTVMLQMFCKNKNGS
jgi:hypothetical protein